MKNTCVLLDTFNFSHSLFLYIFFILATSLNYALINNMFDLIEDSIYFVCTSINKLQ